MEDRELREVEAELSSFSLEAMRLLLDEAGDEEVFSEALEANARNPEIVRMIFDHPNTPEDVRRKASQILKIPFVPKATAERDKRGPEGKAMSRDDRELALAQRLKNMTVGERIKLAIRGNKEIRTVLLKDTNKQVVMGVVRNPKLNESEVEMIAKSRAIPEEALREVAKNKEWMKNYNILYALVTNPKTPAGVSISFLPHLKLKDMQLLDKNKNIPEALRISAKRLVEAKKKTR